MNVNSAMTETKDLQAKSPLSGVLVEAEWLSENLDNPNVVVIEVYQKDAPADEKNVGIIPNARRVHWKKFLWESKRREFADPETLSKRLGELGVSADAEVIICGDPIQFGTYAYLTLKMAGNDKIRMLNGGKARWIRLGLPLSFETTSYPTLERPVGLANRSAIVGREEVLASLDSDDIDILDVRSDEEYLGERVSPRIHVIDNGAQAWGRIPGATHLFYQNLINEDGRFLDREELLVRFESAGVLLDRPVFIYCRLGHRASLAWFVLSEIVGFDSARVYDGSWTEWGSMVGMPIER